MNLMQIEKKNDTQIEISSGERGLTLPYFFYKDGKKITPDDLRLKDNQIFCRFGKSEIIDEIRQDEGSLEIERNWKIEGEGKIQLSFQIKTPEKPESWINPCVNYNGNPKGEGDFPKPKPGEGWSFREDRLGIPSCSIIRDSKGPLAVFTTPAKTENEISSVETVTKNSETVFNIRVPLTEKPKRHTGKYYLNGLSGKKEKHFKIKNGLKYSRKFYITWKEDPEASYHELLKEIWKKLDPDWEKHDDWGRNSEHRINHVINNLYVEREDASGLITAVHRGLIPVTNTISGGFVGKNPEICHTLYKAYLDSGEEKLKEISFKVLDFFTEAQLPNGLLLSDYQLAREKWFGLHFSPHEGCSTRMMSEMAYNFIRTYNLAKKHGEAKEKWLKMAEDFCDFMVRNQPEDGNYGRWWSKDGELKDPSSTNGSYVIWPLVKLYKLKGSEKYLEAAEKAMEYHIEKSVDKDLYWGDALDSNCIDKEGGHSILRSLILLHDVTEKERYLEKAKKTANYVLTWTYFYDVPFSDDTPLGKRDVTTTGATSVSAAHHHLDPYGAAIAYDWLKLWKKTGDEVWKEYALAALDFVHQLVSTEEDPLGFPEYFEGWQPEQLGQTEWDYLSNALWGRGHFKSIISWVPALTLGGFFDIREDFPEIMDFEIEEINERKSGRLKAAKKLRKLGMRLNYFV